MCLYVCRLFSSGGGWYRPQNTHAALLDKFWTKLQMGNMSRQELKQVKTTARKETCVKFDQHSAALFVTARTVSLKVLLERYPNLAMVVERLLDIYCQLTGDKHPDSGTADTHPQGGLESVEMVKQRQEARGLSLR